MSKRAGTGLKTVGLFAGIGGLELGLTRAGHEIAFLCEIDPAARAVLKTGFSGIEIKEDIRLIPKLPRETELVAAGFPCQDLSQAGPTRGMRGEKSSIVSQVFKLLEKTRVQWVLLENVPFMLRLHRGAANISCVTPMAVRSTEKCCDDLRRPSMSSPRHSKKSRGPRFWLKSLSCPIFSLGALSQMSFWKKPRSTFRRTSLLLTG